MATRSVPSVSASPGRLSIVEIEVPARDTTSVSASGVLSVIPAAATVEDQSLNIGSDTLSGHGGAGGARPVFSGGTPTLWAISGGQSANYAINSSTGYITPASDGSAVNGDTFTLTVDGADTATITIVAAANTYSVATIAEVAAAMAAIGTGGGKSILARSGTYAELSTALKDRAFTSEVILGKHTGEDPIFTALDINNTDNLTVDGIKVYRTDAGALIRIKAGSTSITVQNCELYGNLDEDGDYSDVLPTAINGITRDGTADSANITIRNNEIHHVYFGISGFSCTGTLAIKGNYIHDVYEDGASVGYLAGMTTTITDNVFVDVFSGGDDDGPGTGGGPHADFIQLSGTGAAADWSNITIERNTFLQSNTKSVTCIRLGGMPDTYFFNNPRIAGNVVVNSNEQTHGIVVEEAKACVEIFGNTVVSHLGVTPTSGYKPGIVIGNQTSSGTHILKGNVADVFSVAGSWTDVDNVTLGERGATISYATAFDGPDFDPATVAEVRTMFAMKDNGPLDIDNSGTASVDDAGAIGSGYVTWATTIPGDNGTTDADYEVLQEAETTTLLAKLNGSAPDAARISAINDLIVAIKAIGFSTKIGGFYDFTLAQETGNELDGKINWIDTDHNLTESGTITFDASGASSPDTSVNSLSTGFNPSTDTDEGLVLNSAHIGIYMETNQQGATNSCGNTNLRIQPRNASDQTTYRANDGTSKTVASQTDSRGHWVVSRTANDVCPLYRNGSSINAGTTTSTSMTANNICFFNITAAASFAQTMSMGHWGAGLTAGEVSDLYTAIAAYRTAIGL